MKRFGLGIAAAVLLATAGAAAAEETVKVAWCARTVSSAAAPFAVAIKLGWFAKSGIKVELNSLPGSTDCVKLVATGSLDYALPSVEPLAIIRPQGVKAKVFYTAYVGNTYGLAVPVDSPIKDAADLRGKRIGVTSMSSGGVLIARALLANAGIDPDKDAKIIVAGEGAQTAALVQNHQIDALSQFDTQYTLVEHAWTKLRMLAANKQIANFPGNGFIALEARLKAKPQEAIALAQGYAKGTIFAIANPAAAVRMLYEIYPQTKPTGKDEATAIADDVETLLARARSWNKGRELERPWGLSSLEDYAAYVDFMLKWGVIKEKVAAADLVTNDLIADINKIDVAAIEAEAKAYQ
jgi:NitT/TauT family transport system substrate-binding protein